MNYFWQGFEKQSIALRPEYREAFQSKAKGLLKKVFSGSHSPFSVHHQVHIPKETEEALSRVAKSGTKDLQKALKDVEDLKKFRAKDLLLPLTAGGVALGSSLYLGKSLGQKLTRKAPGVFEQPTEKKTDA